ncbi:phospholipase D1 [Planoprotostelium fungivorum]|uniref:GTP 3',8-cyclase n=1 Tax=Planoprotostelium fungivorum TaxID=1890364 RepID=A0A2P6MX67_9EUKA|nr:phospholipase D1 [Planoprotostelium fungivorum]
MSAHWFENSNDSRELKELRLTGGGLSRERRINIFSGKSRDRQTASKFFEVRHDSAELICALFCAAGNIILRQLNSAEKLRETLSNMSDVWESTSHLRSSIATNSTSHRSSTDLSSKNSTSYDDPGKHPASERFSYRKGISDESSQTERSYSDVNRSVSDEDEVEGLWLFTENGKKMIRGASLPTLIQFLTTTKDQEYECYIGEILCTYQAFIFPMDLLLAMENRYRDPTGATPLADFTQVQHVQQCIANAIHLWVAEQIRDFIDDEKLRTELREFVESCHMPGYSPYLTLKAALEALSDNLKWGEIQPPVRQIDDALNTPFDRLQPETIAQVLTDLEWNLFFSIRPKEFLFQSWLKQDSERTAPNLAAAIQWNTQTIAWVTTEVKGAMDPTRRVSELFLLNNFNGVVGILSGIRNPNGTLIAEISQSPDVREKYHQLDTLMNPARVYGLYRKHLKSCTTPRIPYLDVFLTQMAYLDYTNPDLLEGDNILNIHKYHQMGNKILKFQRNLRRRSAPYDTVEHQNAKSYLLGTQILSRDFYFPNSGYTRSRSNTQDGAASEARLVREESLAQLREEVKSDISSASDEDIDRISRVIMKQGEFNRRLYIIRSGMVKIMKTNPNHKTPINIRTVGPGKILGELSILHFGVTSASVVASTDVVMSEVDIKVLHNFFKADPAVASRFYKKNLIHKLRTFATSAVEPVQEVDPSQTRKDRKYAKLFHLPAYEAVIHEFYCQQGRRNGDLYISQNYFCFMSKFFAHRTRERIALDTVHTVTQDKDRVIIRTEGDKKYEFRNFKQSGDMENCYNVMNRVLKTYRERASEDQTKVDGAATLDEEEVYSLSQKDWEFIRRGAKFQAYKKDQVILEQGEVQEKIFYIAKGSCKATTVLPSGGVGVLNVMVEEETFGEMSFLDKIGASACVVAAEDGVEIFAIEGSFVNLLSRVYPDIASKFYRYIASILASRVRSREMKSLEACSTTETNVKPSTLLEEGKGYSPEKSGSLVKRSGGKVAHWRTRFCQVVGGMFIIYDTEGEEDAKVVRRVFPLVGATLTVMRDIYCMVDGIQVSLQLPTIMFKISNIKWNRSFGLDSLPELKEWVGAILQWTEIESPYRSFAPTRMGTEASWLIDGEQTYATIAEAMCAAKESIYITDWFMTPELFMKRDATATIEDRLDKILRRKAREGVKVYILLWKETSIAVKLNSAQTKRKMLSLHENIQVIRHPPLEPLNWSHHQKTVVVDGDIAFVGGMDLCYGRWDTQDHRCVDNCHLNTLWPGKDYANPNKRSLDHPEAPFREHIDRETVPRMAWHDISVRLDGMGARDVAYNFIQRWNHHKEFNGETNYPYLIPKAINSIPPTKGTCRVQLLRSITEWSGGVLTERSIYNAMIDMIQKAEHYIYIENQYFISSLASGGIENTIAEEILKRIIRAIREGQVFRVFVLIPVLPDGVYEENAGIRYIMKWQYDTICRGGRSIMEQIHTMFPDVDPLDYITFHSLRSHGNLDDVVVTEQIYVHSKLMITDDRRVLIGSANINDRSLRGDRDSEIACLIEDTDSFVTRMNRQEYTANRFAFNLRVNLWGEHLGLNPEEIKLVADPVSTVTYKYWRLVSSNNTKIFVSVFPGIPQDSIASLNELNVIGEQPMDPDKDKLLGMVKGHLVDFSLSFLKNESLRPEFTDMRVRAVDKSIFHRRYSNSSIQRSAQSMPVVDEMLIDTFSRKHNYLRISLTERCNLRCQYCMPEEGIELTPSENIMTQDEILRIATLFVESGVTKIRLTGGEPLVRKDVVDICERLGALPGLKHLGMTTNGLTLPRKIGDLHRVGVNLLNISLDTLKADKFTFITRRLGFERVKESIDLALNKYKFNPVKINCVVMKGFNDDEIWDFVEMTKEQDMEIRFIEYMPFGGNRWSDKKFISYQEIIDKIKRLHPEFKRIPEEEIASETSKLWKVPGYKGRIGFITSMSQHFCSSCNRLRLTADGNLKVCLFGQEEVNLKDYMRKGATDEELRRWIDMAVKKKKSSLGGKTDMYELAKGTNRPMILIGG